MRTKASGVRFPEPAILCAAWWLCLVPLVFAGCGRPSAPVSSTYGTSRTADSFHSLNGTSVFAELLRKQGLDVIVGNRISPAIERFQTIVWFCDPERGCPTGEVVDYLKEWGNARKGRVILFVGWSYDAGSDYWSRVAQSSDGETRRSALRQRALAIARGEGAREERMSDNDDSGMGEQVPAEPELVVSCDWFRMQQGVPAAIENLLMDGKPGTLPGGTLRLGAEQLVPLPGARDSNQWYQTLDGRPIAFQVDRSRSGTDARVIVVSNGSFLLNYPLAVPGNGPLIRDFLARLSTCTGPALFVVASDVRFTDREIDNETAWSWINRPPLKFMIPHFLVLGLLFLVSRLPILGRPRRWILDQQPGFARHLLATGSLLRRSGNGAEYRAAQPQASERKKE